ncbi:hypothetical protein ELQ39_06845 [Streptomyces sp. GB4-14]|uniref:hypothetical protein n=1 Tax=Streptomyces sp. GB4-14 TaxID=2498703 RepID=UPI001F5DC7B0|nr:hypothetical protein [Streptomyces sp. GB4-14]
MRTAMDVARLHRNVNHILLDLQRAVDTYAVAEAADLYGLAWSQVAEAPPSETRKQREELQAFKKVINSASWLEEGRRRAATAEVRHEPPAGQRSTARPGRRPAAKRANGQVPRREAKPATETAAHRAPSPADGSGARTPVRRDEPPLLGTGQLSEIATELRPLLEQTARMGATTTWSRISKRLPGLPRLHRDDQSVILWLVDEERREGEPLLCALLTVGDRQMHPRFPVIAEQLGLPCSGTAAQQRMTWSYEVLKVHQYWRHRRPRRD